MKAEESEREVGRKEWERVYFIAGAGGGKLRQVQARNGTNRSAGEPFTRRAAQSVQWHAQWCVPTVPSGNFDNHHHTQRQMKGGNNRKRKVYLEMKRGNGIYLDTKNID